MSDRRLLLSISVAYGRRKKGAARVVSRHGLEGSVLLGSGASAAHAGLSADIGACSSRGDVASCMPSCLADGRGLQGPAAKTAGDGQRDRGGAGGGDTAGAAGACTQRSGPVGRVRCSTGAGLPVCDVGSGAERGRKRKRAVILPLHRRGPSFSVDVCMQRERVPVDWASEMISVTCRADLRSVRRHSIKQALWTSRP